MITGFGWDKLSVSFDVKKTVRSKLCVVHEYPDANSWLQKKLDRESGLTQFPKSCVHELCDRSRTCEKPLSHGRESASNKTSIKWALDAKRFVVPSLQYMRERVQNLKTKYTFALETKNCYFNSMVPRDYGFSQLYEKLRKPRYFMAARPKLNFYSFRVRRNRCETDVTKFFPLFRWFLRTYFFTRFWKRLFFTIFYRFLH